MGNILPPQLSLTPNLACHNHTAASLSLSTLHATSFSLSLCSFWNLLCCVTLETCSCYQKWLLNHGVVFLKTKTRLLHADNNGIFYVQTPSIFGALNASFIVNNGKIQGLNPGTPNTLASSPLFLFGGKWDMKCCKLVCNHHFFAWWCFICLEFMMLYTRPEDLSRTYNSTSQIIVGGLGNACCTSIKFKSAAELGEL